MRLTEREGRLARAHARGSAVDRHQEDLRVGRGQSLGRSDQRVNRSIAERVEAAALHVVTAAGENASVDLRKEPGGVKSFWRM